MAQLIGQYIINLESTASTNNYAIEQIKLNKIKEGSIIWADEQTAGKGQLTNKWSSSPKKNATFSIVLYPNFIDLSSIFTLSQFVSLALRDFLVSVGIKEVSIKWPNDIYVGNKKIAGILIENSLKGKNIKTAIIGIGLNVNQTKFPSWVPNPISMKMITNDNYLLDGCLKSLCLHLNHRYEELVNGELKTLHNDYLKAVYRFGIPTKFKIKNQEFEATIIDVNQAGKLRLSFPSGDKQLFEFKEVEMVI